MRLDLATTDVHKVMGVSLTEIQKDDDNTTDSSLMRDNNGRLILNDGQSEKTKFGKTKDQILKDILKDRAIQEAATISTKDSSVSYEDFRSILGESRDSITALDQGQHPKTFISDVREPVSSEDKVINHIVNEAREIVIKINDELKMKDARENISEPSEIVVKQRSIDELFLEARQALGIFDYKSSCDTQKAVAEKEDILAVPMKNFESYVAPHLDALCESLHNVLTRE